PADIGEYAPVPRCKSRSLQQVRKPELIGTVEDMRITEVVEIFDIVRLRPDALIETRNGCGIGLALEQQFPKRSVGVHGPGRRGQHLAVQCLSLIEIAAAV